MPSKILACQTVISNHKHKIGYKAPTHFVTINNLKLKYTLTKRW